MRNCPECGALSPVHDTRDVTYTYKNQTTIVPALEGDFCGACGEITFARESGDLYGRAIAEFRRKVDGVLVDPLSILTMRKKLGLGQREAGEIFGGGVNAFSRYETGKAQPPVSTVKLLKLLDRHPELLEEISTSSG